ncbi:MAG: AgmX/PglI C-terminal domain-containing protein [Pseudomonadota bacterium]
MALRTKSDEKSFAQPPTGVVGPAGFTRSETITMDGLFFACLMGICGTPGPTAAAAAISPDAVMRLEEKADRPQAIEAPAASSQDLPRQPLATPHADAPPSTPEGAAQGQAGAEPARGGKASRAANKADIAEIVRRKAKPIRHCYELALVEDPQFSGTIEMQWRIDPSGHVSDASVIDSTPRNRVVETCLLAEIKRWEFRPSVEPIVVGAYPFVFDATLLARHTSTDRSP